MKRIRLIFFIAIMVFMMQAATASAAGSDAEAGLKYEKSFTINQLAAENGLSASKIISKLNIKTDDAGLSINEIVKRYPELSTEIIKDETNRILIEKDIESHKNWKLIMLKFLLWISLVSTLAVIMYSKKKILFKPLLLVVSAVVFGVLLGSDPNPLGTVKDGIILYADEGVLFKPRFVALAFLLLLTLIFSRIFCGWGCQIGVMQDLLYRFKVKKIRIPFMVSNLIRILVFLAMIVSAFVFHIDLFGKVDPFKVYSFSLLELNLGFFVFLMILSLFIYRPWCSLACPFGLIAWVVGKISFLKLHVNNDGCTNCGACTRVCPTRAASGHLKGENSSECFLCDRCREVCPNKSITYGR